MRNNKLRALTSTEIGEKRHQNPQYNVITIVCDQNVCGTTIPTQIYMVYGGVITMVSVMVVRNVAILFFVGGRVPPVWMGGVESETRIPIPECFLPVW